MCRVSIDIDYIGLIDIAARYTTSRWLQGVEYFKYWVPRTQGWPNVSNAFVASIRREVIAYTVALYL